MNITSITVRLVEDSDERLKAFCSMTIDNDFVIRDIKIIEGAKGHFVAMPSRKMSDHCEKCGAKNHLKARFCNHCGAALLEDRDKRHSKAKEKIHIDIAHPINTRCRKQIQQALSEAFLAELENAKAPGYQLKAPDDSESEQEESPETIL